MDELAAATDDDVADVRRELGVAVQQEAVRAINVLYLALDPNDDLGLRVSMSRITAALGALREAGRWFDGEDVQRRLAALETERAPPVPLTHRPIVELALERGHRDRDGSGA